MDRAHEQLHGRSAPAEEPRRASQPVMEDELLAEAARRYGTPLYLYDLTRVSAQTLALTRAFPDARVHYAVKANANGAVLRHVAGLGLGAEALTLGELERALRAGFAPERIVLGGPGMTTELARRALDAGVGLVSLDGPGAYQAFRRQVGDALPERTRFLVRLNPAFDPHTHEHLATAAANSKFGVPLPEARQLAEDVAQAGGLAGFHVHAGSMLTERAVARLVVRSLAPLYEEFPGLELVDVGGGFAVPDPPLEAFAAEYLAFAERYGVTPLLEPGRLLVAEAGVLLTRVLHVKGGEPRHIITDAGMADLLRPALYGAHHPVRVVGATGHSDALPADVDGPLCENADRLARAARLPAAAEGALLCVSQAGAYGFAMASNYGSSLRPAEAVWDGEELRLTRRREQPEDLWRLELP